MMAEMGTPWGFSNSGEMQGQFSAGAVKRELGWAAGPSAVSGLQGLPFQSRAWWGGFLSSLSHHTVSSSRFRATLVKMVPFLVVSRALGLDLALVPGATPKKPFSGFTAHRRPSAPGRDPGDVVAHAPALPAVLLVALGGDEHGQVGLAAGGRESAGDVPAPRPGGSARPG